VTRSSQDLRTLSEGHTVADLELAISTIESYPDKGKSERALKKLVQFPLMTLHRYQCKPVMVVKHKAEPECTVLMGLDAKDITFGSSRSRPRCSPSPKRLAMQFDGRSFLFDGALVTFWLGVVVPRIVAWRTAKAKVRLEAEFARLPPRYKALALYLQGLSHRAVGARLGVSHTTISRWLASPSLRASRSHPPSNPLRLNKGPENLYAAPRFQRGVCVSRTAKGTGFTGPPESSHFTVLMNFYNNHGSSILTVRVKRADGPSTSVALRQQEVEELMEKWPCSDAHFRAAMRFTAARRLAQGLDAERSLVPDVREDLPPLLQLSAQQLRELFGVKVRERTSPGSASSKSRPQQLRECLEQAALALTRIGDVMDGARSLNQHMASVALVRAQAALAQLERQLEPA
jgi:hypothetical protein